MSDKRVVNDCVLNAHSAPRFWLDKTFNTRIQKIARGKNYLEFLAGGGWRDVYEGRSEWKNRRNVKPYTDTLMRVFNMKGSPEEIMGQILGLEGAEFKGEVKTLTDALIDKVKGSPSMIDMLSEEAAGGDISDDAIRALALAPIEPLISILESYEDIGPALDYLGKLQDAAAKQGKKDDPSAEDYKEPAVVIDTCHGWKGLEVDHIFIPMAAGVFPHVRSMDSDEELASERRLAYVALTRGKDAVTVICPSETHMGQPGGVSMFMAEACIKPEGAEEDNPDTPAPPRTAADDERERFLTAFLRGDYDEPDPVADDLMAAWGPTE
jgi:hypothetical protein